jgi:31-O-methyltransferase
VASARSLPNGLSVVGMHRNETDYLYQEIFEDEAYVPRGGLDLRQQPVIFYVGANIGLFTLYALRAWPQARVFAFEPVPAVFAALQANTGHLPNVSLHNIALGERKQTRDLLYYPLYTIMSGFDADPAADRDLARACMENFAAGLPSRFRAAFVAAADVAPSASAPGPPPPPPWSGPAGSPGAPAAKRGRTTLTMILRGDTMPGARRTARRLL